MIQKSNIKQLSFKEFDHGLPVRNEKGYKKGEILCELLLPFNPNRENRKCRKEHTIRYIGKPLTRPVKEPSRQNGKSLTGRDL